MNMNSGINANTSIALIYIFLDHTAAGMHVVTLDLRNMDDALFQLKCMKDYIARLAFDGIGTRIFLSELKPLGNGTYKLIIHAGNRYTRGSHIGECIRLFRTPGFQELNTFVYDEDDELLESLDDGCPEYKQTVMTKVQGRNVLAVWGPLDDITGEDYDGMFIDDDGYLETTRHTL